MAKGFSYMLVKRVDAELQQNPKNPVFLLIKRCILKDIPVTEAARRIGITRAALYGYMDGEYKPKQEVLDKIEKLYRSLAK